MQTTYEKALEIVRGLPPSDLQKLGEWISIQQNPKKQNKNDKSQIKEEVRKFKLAMKWIAEHREEYFGQWVCLDGDELISYGTDAIEVHNKAKAKGIKAPLLERIIEEPKAFSDGWEMVL